MLDCGGFICELGKINHLTNIITITAYKYTLFGMKDFWAPLSIECLLF